MGEYAIAVVYNVERALKTVLFWRGHYQINVCSRELKLPLHSITLFTFGILYVEVTELRISLFFGSISWLMLALLEERRRRPSPWGRPPTYTQLLLAFLFNRKIPETINPNENEEEDKAFLAQGIQKVEKYRKEQAELSQELAKLDAEQADERKLLDTKKRSILSLNFLEGAIHPLQLQLIDATYTLRFVRNLLTWEYRYHSFWLVTVPLILSIISFFIIQLKYVNLF